MSQEVVMFNMAKQSDTGYKLVIVYDAISKKYYVNGYTAHRHDRGNITYEQDGASVIFDNMNDAIKSITEYPDKR